MTADFKISLVIVSRNRPAELKRLLVSLRHLQYLNFEVIVVSNTDPRVLFPEVSSVERVRYVEFDEANISAARNLGIGHARGEIIAFCDDDAVPEPTWLGHLIAPFADSKVAAVGGYVRGRNGISFQWRGRSFDRFGVHSDLEMAEGAPRAFQGSAETGIKTEGTNCAFRRKILADLGGFDENFRYFMDETDLNYRLGIAGWKTAIVPLAQVHHGFAASPTRQKNRAPKSLFEIGASYAWFCKKHLPSNESDQALAKFTAGQRRRLIEFMVDGMLEPRDVSRLLDDLERGYADGQGRDAIVSNALSKAKSDGFERYNLNDNPLPLTMISRRGLRRSAASIRKLNSSISDTCTTLFMFSLSSIFHRMEFDPNGYWIQTGGLFGRSGRSGRVFNFHTLNSRTQAELARISDVRPIS